MDYGDTWTDASLGQGFSQLACIHDLWFLHFQPKLLTSIEGSVEFDNPKRSKVNEAFSLSSKLSELKFNS